MRSFQPGTIIENRDRLWRVNKEVDDVVYATPIDGYTNYEEKFFKPIENIKDGKLAPPADDRMGNPALQKLSITAHKLDLIYGTAPLVSLKKSRVIPTEYQLVPISMALDMPRVRMLLADDVGLGKTIEAGLIITELMARNRVSKILFVVPASLRRQWREEMMYFFHLHPRIISRRHKRALERELPPGTNPWEYFDQLIVSVDYAKKEEVKAQIEGQRWDLILVDEAHKIAKPHQTSSSHDVKKQRWDLAKTLKELSHHILFLTATPHNGYTDTFASLIDLLNVGAVTGDPWDPEIVQEIARNHICQRRRSDIERWLERSGEEGSFFPQRDQKEIIIDLTEREKEVIRELEGLTDHVKRSSERANIHGRTLAKWTIMHLHKRALSSPEAFRKSLENRIGKLKDTLGKLEDLDDEMNNPGIRESEARAVAVDDDTGEELSEEEAGQRLEKVVYTREADIRTELKHLERVYEKAKRVTRGYDSKLQELYEILEGRLPVKPKMIIFTKWIDTQKYIRKSLSKKKAFKNYEIFTLTGTMGEGERKEVFMDFEGASKAVLIATDCISEGLNLQYASSQMIHYELPWNPNRLEQRNGRIDRFGQRAGEVYIRSLVMKDTLDAAVLKVLIKKSYRIKRDYGFSPPFFGDKITLLDLVSQHGIEIGKEQKSLLDFSQMDRGEDGEGGEGGEESPFDEEVINRISSESFYGSGSFDFEDIRRRMRETTEKVGDVEKLKEFVFGALRKFGYNVDRDSAGLYTFTPGRAASTYGGEIGNAYDKVTFDPRRAAENPRLELIDISHPLVRQIIDVLKQRAFDVSDDELYGRTACWCSGAAEEVTVLYHILVRYAVKTDPITILEDIVPVGFPLYREDGLEEEDIIGPERARELYESPGRDHGRTTRELLEDLKLASEAGLEVAWRRIAGMGREEIIRHRREFLSNFGEEEPEWAAGMLDVEVASLDHLTTSIIYPRVEV